MHHAQADTAIKKNLGKMRRGHFGNSVLLALAWTRGLDTPVQPHRQEVCATGLASPLGHMFP